MSPSLVQMSPSLVQISIRSFKSRSQIRSRLPCETEVSLFSLLSSLFSLLASRFSHVSALSLLFFSLSLSLWDYAQTPASHSIGVAKKEQSARGKKDTATNHGAGVAVPICAWQHSASHHLGLSRAFRSGRAIPSLSQSSACHGQAPRSAFKYL